MRLFPIALILTCLSAAPALAQDVPFGDNNSRWANDGECDDPRFSGAGMTQTPLQDEDIKHDAADCEAAFTAGTITLAGDTAAKPAATVADTIVNGLNFGGDTGEWINDGECDDRRFIGEDMAANISWSNVGKDASDCAAAVTAGTIRLWDFNAAKAATQCDAIDFGTDAGAYPNDMECDDQRFEGPAAAAALSVDNIGGDAADCRALCTYGVVFLRDYP